MWFSRRSLTPLLCSYIVLREVSLTCLLQAFLIGRIHSAVPHLFGVIAAIAPLIPRLTTYSLRLNRYYDLHVVFGPQAYGKIKRMLKRYHFVKMERRQGEEDAELKFVRKQGGTMIPLPLRPHTASLFFTVLFFFPLLWFSCQFYFI